MKVLYDPTILLLGINPCKNWEQAFKQKLVPNIHGILIVNSQEMETMQMSIAWWINKTWHIHLLFSHKNKWNTDTHSKWTVSERRQTKGLPHIIYSLMWNVQNRHIHRDTNRIVVSRNSMKGNGEWLFNRYGFPSGWRKSSRISVGDCTSLWKYWKLLNYML